MQKLLSAEGDGQHIRLIGKAEATSIEAVRMILIQSFYTVFLQKTAHFYLNQSGLPFQGS